MKDERGELERGVRGDEKGLAGVSGGMRRD